MNQKKLFDDVTYVKPTDIRVQKLINVGNNDQIQTDEIEKDMLTTYDVQNIIQAKTNKLITVSLIGRLAKRNKVSRIRYNGLILYDKSIVNILLNYIEKMKDIEVIKSRKNITPEKIKNSFFYFTNSYEDALKTALRRKRKKNIRVLKNVSVNDISCLMNVCQEVVISEHVKPSMYMYSNIPKNCDKIVKKLEKNKVSKNLRVVAVSDVGNYMLIFF